MQISEGVREFEGKYFHEKLGGGGVSLVCITQKRSIEDIFYLICDVHACVCWCKGIAMRLTVKYVLFCESPVFLYYQTQIKSTYDSTQNQR